MNYNELLKELVPFLRTTSIIEWNRLDILRNKLTKFGEYLRLNWAKNIDGTKRTSEIRAWKLHHLCAHLLDVIFMYGCVGIWNEEAVESFHQLTKKHFVTLSALPPKIFMEQLFHRYLNEWDVNMNNRS